MRSPLASLLLTALLLGAHGLRPTAAQAQQSADLAYPQWLQLTPASKPAPVFTPTEDPGEMCPLRPSRTSILKLGLAPDRVWQQSYRASVPVVLGYERRITPDVSLTASLGSALAPWNKEGSKWPGLRAFNVTLGARVYLGTLFKQAAPRQEFEGPYVALESRRLFVGQPLPADGSAATGYAYRYQKSQQLMVGIQQRIGGHGFVDMAAGLRRTVAPAPGQSRLAPAATLTVGFIY